MSEAAKDVKAAEEYVSDGADDWIGKAEPELRLAAALFYRLYVVLVKIIVIIVKIKFGA